MITITQVDEETIGANIFSVSLGNQFICRFEHERQNGLADCLHKAADAVELSDWADYVLMDDSKGG